MADKKFSMALWYCNGCNVVIVAPWAIGFVQPRPSDTVYRGQCPACGEPRDFFPVEGRVVDGVGNLPGRR